MEGKAGRRFKRRNRAVAACERVVQQRPGERRRELEKAERRLDRAENVRGEFGVVQFPGRTRVDEDTPVAPRDGTVSIPHQHIVRDECRALECDAASQFGGRARTAEMQGESRERARRCERSAFRRDVVSPRAPRCRRRGERGR